MEAVVATANHQYLYLVFIVFPFAALSIMWIVLMLINRNTTGEVKKVLPPDVLLKVMALFMLVSVFFILVREHSVNESTISALLGAIATGVLGIALKGKGSSSDSD